MKRLVPLLSAVALTGCVTTQEMSLAPNVFHINARALGIESLGQEGPRLLKRAAELTIQGGYTHFRLSNPSLSQGAQTGGLFIQNYGGGFWGATPIVTPTADAGATVTMFKGNPGGAFDARQVLRQYQ